MTDKLIERIDEATYKGKVTEVNSHEMWKLVQLLQDCKAELELLSNSILPVKNQNDSLTAELLAKDEEIERLKKVVRSRNSDIIFYKEEFKHIKSITVEDIIEVMENAKARGVAEAIYNLINGESGETK